MNTTYQPLSSVWESSDAELIEAMLEFYPSIEPDPNLDATYNTGRFWKGTTRQFVHGHRPVLRGRGAGQPSH